VARNHSVAQRVNTNLFYQRKKVLVKTDGKFNYLGIMQHLLLVDETELDSFSAQIYPGCFFVSKTKRLGN
jgi:hypothetical protein